MKKSILLIFALATMTSPVVADWKLSQKIKMSGGDVGRTSTIYQKGVRQRRVDKMDMGKEMNDPEVAAMMAQMGQSMPTFPIHVSQCDLKQDLFINEKNKAFFIDHYDWSNVPPEKLLRRGPNQKMTIKGTLTTDTAVTDSGRRQQMFGLTARWLKVVQTIEESADSCNGYSLTKMEQEGWFVTLSVESESCPIRQPQDSRNDGGCRPRLVVKRAQNSGIMLTGTLRVADGSKSGAAFEIETLDLSKATLDPALFEIPKDFVEVDSQAELSSKRGPVDTSAKTIYSDGGGPKAGAKTIAIDFFSGNASKVNQDELRNYISQKLTASGLSGFPINSKAELATGKFAYLIGVELKKVKESGAVKIGGLFGKVIAGGDDAAKIGESEAEIIISVYSSDGKTVVATGNATEKVKGKANDAVKAAIDKIVGPLIEKLK